MGRQRQKRPYVTHKGVAAYDDALAGLKNLKLKEQQLRESLYAGDTLELILLELVETQESAMELLQKWEAILHKHQSSEPQQQQQLTWREQLQAIRASSSNDSQAGKINNGIRMLQTATEADVLLAASLTADDWRQYTNEMVRRLMPLINIAEKPWLAPLNNPSQPSSTAATSGTAAAAAQTAAGGASGNAASSRASLAVAPATTAVTAAAGAASAGSQPVSADTMTEDMVLPAQAVQCEIESIFDEYFKYGFLSCFINPNALVEACATNFATGQPAAAPPQHWREMVRRLNPTDEQLQHMKIGLRLHERVDAGLQQRITPVVEKAVDATPLLQMTQNHGMSSSNSTAGTEGATAPQQSTAPASQAGIAAKVAVVAAAAAAAGQEAATSDDSARSLDKLLQRAVRYKQLNMVTTAFIVNNTFTKLQGCVAMVTAWPFGPVAVAVAEACVEELEFRQQQQRQRQQELNQPSGQPARRSWQVGQEEGGGQQDSRQMGLRSELEGVTPSTTAANGDGTSWPTFQELMHRNAQYHMKQRVAEMRIRQTAWHQEQALLAQIPGA